MRLVVVGDGPEREALERRAAEPDMAGRVEFLGRVVPAWPVFSRFDVYATSSESEGIPISVLEAMAAGLPVVATAVGGLPETVKEGVTGFLVKRGPDRAATAAALAGRLAEVLSDAALRDRMGAAGRDRVTEHFSSQAVGATMMNLYEKALAARESIAPSPWTVRPAAKRAGSAWPAVSVLGFRMDIVDLEDAAQWVVQTAGGAADGAPGDAAAAAGLTGPVAPAGRTALALSFNPELVMRAQEDRCAAEVLRAADLAYPDGVGAVWAARRRLAGASGREVNRVAGIDLAQRVLELAAVYGLRVFFLGAKPGVAEDAARRQKSALPGLRIAGHRDGYFGPAEEAAVVAAVRESGADILFVAMGAPRQETLLYDHRDEWGAGVALGIGGSFDVWAGTVDRAPDLIRKAGIEWLYRLVREPKRLRRQMVLPRYALRVIRGGDQ